MSKREEAREARKRREEYEISCRREENELREIGRRQSEKKRLADSYDDDPSLLPSVVS